MIIDDLETWRMRVVACSDASFTNTPKTAAERINRDNPYWTAAYDDVCDVVDREMALRIENERLRNEVSALHSETASLHQRLLNPTL